MNASGDNNRSVRFTKSRIRTAYFSLMENKSIHKITVAEIVRTADISRATFYLHYSDTYDLLQQTEEEIISSIISEIMKFDEASYTVGEYPIARKVFGAFDTYSNEIRLLLGENGDTGFSIKFHDTVTAYFEKLLSPLIKHKENLHPVLSFLVGGVLNMFIMNLQSDSPVDTDTLALISNRYLRATNKLLGLPELEND